MVLIGVEFCFIYKEQCINIDEIYGKQIEVGYIIEERNQIERLVSIKKRTLHIEIMCPCFFLSILILYVDFANVQLSMMIYFQARETFSIVISSRDDDNDDNQDEISQDMHDYSNS